jgi:8-oxo-dGTP diphosphatase
MATNQDIQIARERVVCYITRARRELLVFEHDNPSLSKGLNPVAGGVDPGESSQAAALRETLEESGLALEHAVHLESRIIQGNNGLYQRWHFMWLEASDTAPDAWQHIVTGEGERDLGRIYAHRFVLLENFSFADTRLDLALPSLKKALGARQKAICYITRDQDILVFDHTPEYPTAGTQVPSGGLEPGETPAQAATREAFEETGLEGLSTPMYLGSRLWENGMTTQVWHFFHLEITSASTLNSSNAIPDSWVQHADDHVFLHRFEPISSTVIHYGFGAMLPELQVKLELSVTPSRNAMRSCAVCYITRDVVERNVAGQGDHEGRPYEYARELLIFEGHPGGGVQIVAGGLDDAETPEQCAVREAWEEVGLRLESPRFLGIHEVYFKGQNPFRNQPTEFHELRHCFHFHIAEPRDAWTHTVSGGDMDGGLVFQHRFVRLEDVRLDWDLGEFVPQLKLERGEPHA